MQILYVEWSVKIVDFGTRLKALRKQAGLTQQQLAAQLGITKSVVSFYELQARSPSPEVLAKLAQIFHVSADYLLGLDSRETIDVSGVATGSLLMQTVTMIITGLSMGVTIYVGQKIGEKKEEAFSTSMI